MRDLDDSPWADWQSPEVAVYPDLGEAIRLLSEHASFEAAVMFLKKLAGRGA